jgi:hypothetical protein
MNYQLINIAPVMNLDLGDGNGPQAVCFAVEWGILQVQPKSNASQPGAVWGQVDDGTGFKYLMNMRHGTYLRYWQPGQDWLGMSSQLDPPNMCHWKMAPVAPWPSNSVLQNQYENRVLRYKASENKLTGFHLPTPAGNIQQSPADGQITWADVGCMWNITNPSGVSFSIPRLDLSSNRALKYQVDLSNLRQPWAPPGDPLVDISAAIGDWMKVFAQFGLSAPVTATQGTPADITFCWGTIPPGEAGQTPGGTGSGSLASRPAGGVTITLDQTKYWFATQAGRALGKYHLRSVAAHELGHVFGLEHNQDPSSVMQAMLLDNTISVDDQHPICNSDVARLRARYIDLN